MCDPWFYLLIYFPRSHTASDCRQKGAGLCIAQSLNTNSVSYLGRMGWIVSVFPDLRDRLEAGEEALILGDCLLNIPTAVASHSNQANRGA